MKSSTELFLGSRAEKNTFYLIKALKIRKYKSQGVFQVDVCIKIYILAVGFKGGLYKVGSTGLDDEKCTARAQLRLNFRSSGSTGAKKMGSFHLYTSLRKEYAIK